LKAFAELQRHHNAFGWIIFTPDASTISVKSLKGTIRSIQSIRDLRFLPAELKLFLGMTAGLLQRIQLRLEEIRLSGS
jgi:hypothetical protein